MSTSYPKNLIIRSESLKSLKNEFLRLDLTKAFVSHQYRPGNGGGNH